MAAGLIAQPWHKAYWSMKERKRLQDEYATGEMEREKERIKYASDTAEGREVRGDDRRYKYDINRDDMKFGRDKEMLDLEYGKRGEYGTAMENLNAANRLAEMQKQQAFVADESSKARSNQANLIQTEAAARQQTAQAEAERARKIKRDAIAAEYLTALQKSQSFVPQAALKPLAEEKAERALKSMDALELRRGAALDAAVTENPMLGLPGGLGAVVRQEEGAAERAQAKEFAERFMPGQGGGGGGARPAPKRIKLGQRRTELEELDRRYMIGR